MSRRDLIDLCAAMQQNLRTAKSAFSSERSAVKALRKELQHERVSRIQGRYPEVFAENKAPENIGQMEPKMEKDHLPIMDFQRRLVSFKEGIVF